MSLVKAKRVQLNSSATATQNFVLDASDSNGTMKLARGNSGATTQDIITVDASGNVTIPQNLTVTGTLTGSTIGNHKASSNTAVTTATTSDITGVPANVKRITLMASGISINSNEDLLIQLGTSSAFVTTGYTASAQYGTSRTTATTGFTAVHDMAAANTHGLNLVFTLMEPSTNTWLVSGSSVLEATGSISVVYGRVSLSGALTRMRLTTIAGTGVFDGGVYNVLYEV